MSPTALSELEEKDGHRIKRQIVEQFAPWCSICKRVVWDFYLDTELEAKRYLIAHVTLLHGDDLRTTNFLNSYRDMKLDTPE